MVGKTYFIECPSYEGIAVVLGLDDVTARIKDCFSGCIYVVEVSDLVNEVTDE